LKILAIGAHTGDPLESCGGTLAKHVSRGDDVAVVALTGHDDANEKFWMRPSGKPMPEWVKKKRQELLEAGARVLGVKKARNLNYDIPLVIDRESFLPIIDVVREFKPDVVLTHHPNDQANPDHFIASSLIVRAVGYARSLNIETDHSPYNATSLTQIIYCTNFMPASKADFFVDVSSTIDLVGKAYYEAHYMMDQNELERLTNLFRDNAYSYHLWSGLKYAEPFKYSHAYDKPKTNPEYLPSKNV